MSGSGDSTLPFYPPDLKLFIYLGKTNWWETLVRKKVGTKI